MKVISSVQHHFTFALKKPHQSTTDTSGIRLRILTNFRPPMSQLGLYTDYWNKETHLSLKPSMESIYRKPNQNNNKIELLSDRKLRVYDVIQMDNQNR